MTNSAIFIYAFKSIILSGICFGYYSVFLKNTLMHQYNRFYLLASLLLSLFGPLVKLDFLSVEEEQVANISQTIVYLNSPRFQPVTNQTDWNQIGLYIAISISLGFLAYLALGIYKIYQIKRAHPVTLNQGIEIVNTNLENAPFSFLNLLFWKQSIELTSEQGQKIFQHELAHIRQKHTYDRLFCQFASSIAWFNPFHWLISKELQNIHEFIADREAIQNGDIQDFAKMLLQTHYGNEFLNPSHSFYYSSLKRRIMLITTSKSPKFAYLRRAAALPIVACGLILCSIQINAQSKKAKKNAKSDFLVSIQPDSTTFSDPKTGKKVFAVATRDMPPPPPPSSIPNPPTPPENPSKFVKVITVDSNNFEFKSTINGKVVTVSAKKINNGTSINGKPISMKADSVSFVSVPTEKIKALIVIDGAIVKDLDLNKINPQTIESMNVLKGEKATEKYGKSGANGVVEITTKKH